MASIASSTKGHRRILFYGADKTRRTIHLGKCSMSDATKIKLRVESLLNSKILGNDPKAEDATWLMNEGKYVREKLAVVGLCESVAIEDSKTLKAHLEEYYDRRKTSVKPGTLAVWRQVMANLNDVMPKGIKLHEVTAGHAKQFLEGLRTRKMATSTIHKRIDFCKQFFEDAADWELIPKNPFAKVQSPDSSSTTNVEVSLATIKKVIEVCDPTWRIIVALSRFGGLRTPSETLSLKWSNIDWGKSIMHLPEPKLEHHEGRGVRECPIFEELMPYLQEAWDLAEEGAEYVVDKPIYRAAANTGDGWKNSNLRTQFLKKLKKAGVVPWARLFHSMRASRQTELEQQHPLHVVCKWLGNSPSIAQKSYLLVTDADVAKAIGRGTNPTRAGQKSSHGDTKTTPQTPATDTQTSDTNQEKDWLEVVLCGNSHVNPAVDQGRMAVSTAALPVSHR